jgi:hypothetical protein
MPSAKFLIFTKRGFDSASGGNVLLHKLCHDLRGLGQDAYISHGPSGPDFKAPQYMPSVMELKNEFIVVYPETTIGNPLKCSRVVRWILNTPGAFGPTKFYKRENKSDLIFKLSTFYDYAGTGDYKGVLYTLYIDFKTFRNYGLKRSGSCHLIRKGKVINQMHDEDSILLDNPGDWKSAAHLLNTKEILYCYDTATYLGVLAALCGCVCMVIPDGKRTPEEWRASWPHNKFGVAYGSNQLDYARQTLALTASHLKGMEQEGIKTIEDFMEITKRCFSMT